MLKLSLDLNCLIIKMSDQSEDEQLSPKEIFENNNCSELFERHFKGKSNSKITF